MSNMNIYPFTRTIVLEQKTQQEQNALLSNTNRDVNPLVTPADYTPVIVTNQPIIGVTDQLSQMKPTISVVEESPAPIMPTAKQKVKSSGQKQPLIGTIVATALLVTAGFFLYQTLAKRK